MRPVMMGDVIAAARVLCAARVGDRAALMRRLLRAASLADRHRRRTGRAHPAFGNGSLMAVARRRSSPAEPPLHDPAYLDCLCIVLAALRADAAVVQPRAQSRQRGTVGSSASRRASISSPQDSQ